MKNQVLKFILKNILSGIIIMLSMVLTGFLLVFAAVVFPGKVNNGEVLDASTINNIIDNLFWKSDSSGNISYTGGNVGIGTNTPSEKLDLGGGNVKMGYQTINSSYNAGDSTLGRIYAQCPSGKYLLGGSCTTSNGGMGVETIVSGNNSFGCYKYNTSNSWSVIAICANIR